MNWWAVTTIGMWVSCALATAESKKPDIMMYAIAGSVLLGIFYCIVNGI